jgi:hypothetical protein
MKLWIYNSKKWNFDIEFQEECKEKSFLPIANFVLGIYDLLKKVALWTVVDVRIT